MIRKVLKLLKYVLLDDANLEENLNSIRKTGLLQQTRVLPEVEYRFKHALIQEVAYDSLLSHQLHHLLVSISSEPWSWGTGFGTARPPDRRIHDLVAHARHETACCSSSQASEKVSTSDPGHNGGRESFGRCKSRGIL